MKYTAHTSTKDSNVIFYMDGEDYCSLTVDHGSREYYETTKGSFTLSRQSWHRSMVDDVLKIADYTDVTGNKWLQSSGKKLGK